MKKIKTIVIIRIALITGTIISLFYVPWVVVFAWLAPLPDTVDEVVNEAIDLGFDGIIVYVDQGGKEPAFYAAGLKNKEQKIPADPHSLFKLASISKLYNAVAVAKLVNDGRLSLDKTLADYMPELKGRIEYADEITLRMMVQHRSGIPNYTDTYYYWANPKETSEENLALILDQPANFKPGESYEYCNTNYLLLAEIMDKVLGYPHFEYIRERILNRLNLKNTFASLDEVNIDDVMSGYYVGHPYDLKTNNQGMLATAEDVGIFIRALNDCSLFDDGENEIYSSIYVYGHTGLIPGYQSIAKYHENIDAVIVQFTNTVNFDGYNWNLSEILYSRIVERVGRDKNL